jgi:hypothetical protein
MAKAAQNRWKGTKRTKTTGFGENVRVFASSACPAEALRSGDSANQTFMSGGSFQ